MKKEWTAEDEDSLIRRVVDYLVKEEQDYINGVLRRVNSGNYRKAYKWLRERNTFGREPHQEYYKEFYDWMRTTIGTFKEKWQL